jgi:hypothetical protein
MAAAPFQFAHILGAIHDSTGKIGLDVQTGWEGVGCRGIWEKDEVTDAVMLVNFLIRVRMNAY